MAKDSLRVSTGEKRIEVNDNGEYIILNIGDQSFLPRLSHLIDQFNGKLPEYEERAKEIEALYETTEEIKEIPENTDGEKYKKFFYQFEKITELAKLNEQVHHDLMDEIDNLFRDSVCKKVFGNIVPSMDMFADFFNQLSPYIEKFGKERSEKMSKYSAKRDGNG